MTDQAAGGAPGPGTTTGLARALLASRASRSAEEHRPSGRTEGPLSPAQERFWLMEQFDWGGDRFQLPRAYRLLGELDEAALEVALTAIAQRHEILRTTFSARDGVPCQRVGPMSGPVLRVVDLSGRPDAAAGVLTEAIDAVREPLSLGCGPLWRAVLFRLSPAERVLVVVLHHIAADAPSFGVIEDELSQGYAAARAGRAVSLPPLPMQYIDVAAWQRSRFTDAERKRLGAWWSGALADAPQMLAWPAAAGPADGTDDTEPFVRRPIPVDVAEGIAALARTCRTTPFVVSLAMFGVLLARYCGQSDLLIGIPASDRTQTEHEGMVGCFLDLLVMRVDLRSDPTVGDYVRQMHRVVGDALAHRDMPFQELVRLLKPARGSRRTPVFQAVFSVNAGDADPPQLDGLRTEPFTLDGGAVAYDLVVSFEGRAPEISGMWGFNPEVLGAASVAELAEDFEPLARSMLARPSDRISQLPPLPGRPGR
jgi:hypothetical protein